MSKEDYAPISTEPMPVIHVDGPSTLCGPCLAITVPDGTSDADAVTLYGVTSWAKSHGLPHEFVQKLPKLARRDPRIVREICDELAELGFPITANELRAYWRA